MDYAGQFQRDVTAFEAATRSARTPAAPVVPSCPGWVLTDLVLHLGTVHRYVARVIGERMQQPPGPGDRSGLGLTDEWQGWLPPGRVPEGTPVPGGLLDWFREGAADLLERFRTTEPAEQVWTWWPPDQSVGFWLRMQAIEAAVHRWDAENAVGTARPLDAALAADAVGQTFQVMALMRRAVKQAPPGQGERYLFRRTDGPGTWTVRFDGDAVLLDDTAGLDDTGRLGAQAREPDIRISGTASDLALFLWQRPVADNLDVTGDRSLLSRYFALVPPV